jgi:hypothetical protein
MKRTNRTTSAKAMPNKWNKPDRVQSNVKRTRSSSVKQYQPIDLSKQTKIHVLGDLDLKALITPIEIFVLNLA